MQNPLQMLQSPSSAPGIPGAGNVSVDVPISTSTKSAAESSLNSAGSKYDLRSGDFIVGGSKNDMLPYILGAVAVGLFFILKKHGN